MTVGEEAMNNIRENFQKMSFFSKKGKFLVRGDGLMQFPVGKHVVSVGFGFMHYASDDGTRVEVAIMRDGEFVTREFLPDLHDDVASIGLDEFDLLLLSLLMVEDE